MKLTKERDNMETYYAMIDGNVTEIRVPKTEVRNDRWEGYVVGKTVTELMTNCGAVVINTINNIKGDK